MNADRTDSDVRGINAAVSTQQSAISQGNGKTGAFGMNPLSPLDLGMTGEGWARGIAGISDIARHRRDRKVTPTTEARRRGEELGNWGRNR
jgi:hypothetical protein